MNDGAIVYEVRLDGVAVARQSALAAELREYLLDRNPDLDVRATRAEPSAQDVGAALQVILAAPAVILLARGVQQWLARRATATVTFSCGTKRLRATNLSSRSAEVLARELIALSVDSGTEN